MKPIKKIPWAHSTITKLSLNWSSRKGSPVFHVNLWRFLTEALNFTSLCLNFIFHFLPQISPNSKIVLLCNFQISIKPNTKRNSGWWNLAVDWKKKENPNHWDNLWNLSLLVLPKWALGTALHQRQMHAVMSYRFMCSWYMLDRHPVVCEFTENHRIIDVGKDP